MLKTFRWISDSKGKKIIRFEKKKNHAVLKFDRSIEGTILNNILKVLADGSSAGDRGHLKAALSNFSYISQKLCKLEEKTYLQNSTT